MLEGTSVTAVLGPTNTGKTHRAVERMLEHRTGMLGLPLRLLAREVYDKLTTRLGESRVALVTGEEKRVPRRPDYWVATVEAMPIEREVDFLAIDEVQLAEHDQRGHVFTDRLLSARGRLETWFLGAETVRTLLSELVPTAKLAGYPRLSQLSFTGATPLAKTPPRSAVVGFSTAQVYEVAERLRALRGGTAVVLGALSPRTRNAQVAMFQAGEVDYLVATDAIGMGLNLDIGHVAFASLRKFDGREVRELELAELGQIAGRAGRYVVDGTFGTVAPVALAAGAAAAVENHRFPAVRRVLWRNADLDFSSLESLAASLAQRPRARCLTLVQGAEDAEALARLARDPDVATRARGPDAVALLWDVCRIPDYRKLLLESHVALLAEVYGQLAGSRGVLDEDWMDARIREIDDPGGDIETLTARIASIRTFTYISNQSRWVKRAEAWQGRAREVEDRLSDALHDRLVQRFVARRACRSSPAARPHARTSASLPQRGAVAATDPSHPFARLSSMRAALAGEPEGPLDDRHAWVESLVAAPHARFATDAGGRILYDGKPVGRLARGPSLLLPEVRLLELEGLGAGARARVLRRLVAFARDLVAELLDPLRAAELGKLSAAGRGVTYQLEQGLGTAYASGAREQLGELTEADRELLVERGVVLGERVLFLPGLLRRESVERRLALCSAWFESRAKPASPRPGAVSIRVSADADPRAHAAIGYPVFATRALRADVAERVHRALGAAGDAPPPDEGTLASWMGCPAREVPHIARALGEPPARA